MPNASEPANAAGWTPEEIRDKSDRELLEAIWSLESHYSERDHALDHRRHLDRNELENVFVLVQRLTRLRLSSAQAEATVSASSVKSSRRISQSFRQAAAELSHAGANV